MKNACIEQFFIGINLDGMSSRTYAKIPPPNLFLSKKTKYPLKYLVGFRYGKKHFVKIVTSLVTVYLKRHYIYVYTLFLPKNHYFKPF